jgi:glucose-1-phosphate cytidylyltransferase
MKVVLFCGGLGLRLREHSETVPKPMVPIGYRPVLWYIMRYYAHHGHTEFILCLGHQSHMIKDYFRNYDETLTNDFILDKGDLQLLESDIENWTITFVDTGLKANIGQRLLAVKKHLGDDEMFLANYADVLTDADLGLVTKELENNPDLIGAMLCVQPNYTFHVVRWGEEASTIINEIHDVRRSETWINGGYFAFRREIFDYLNDGEELVVEPFQRLIDRNALAGIRHDGFWAPMDTLKEKLQLDKMHENGDRPWCVWDTGN